MHPREFGKYRIIRLLPLGGMGRVYLAEDPATSVAVALKLIELGPDRDRQEIVEAERRGAMLQERLCHIDRRVTEVRGYGELDGFFFIEMEYVDGQDLSEVLEKGPLGVPFAARIGRDLCEVLGHSHGFYAEIEGHRYHGVVHGDIKPRNIRITPQGEVRVLDFGIAKALSLTRKFTQNQFGSSQYSSPERLSTADVDFASDLWSVGVVLFEVVTGRPYFEADSGPKLDHLIRSYRQHRPLPPHIPAPFAAILKKALHPDPSLRYTTASEFAADLEAFLEKRPTSAESDAHSVDPEATRRTNGLAMEFDEGRTRRTVRPTAVPVLLPMPEGRRPMSRRERQVRLLAGALLALILGVMFYNEYSVWRGGANLRRELETERLTDMSEAWTRYQALANRNYLPLVLHGTRRAVLERLTAVADRTINDYRSSDAPAVMENDWVRAQQTLSRALDLNPSDKEIRGKLYLAEGHLNRIRGTSRASGKLLNEARAKFDGARELLPKSPDPYLGLARLYVYSLKDVEKAEEALRAADKRGYEPGRREKAQLADGYRDRAERLLKEADRATGLPEEKDYLERARNDFERAEELYRGIVPFGGSAASLRRVLDYADHVELRLKIIREGA